MSPVTPRPWLFAAALAALASCSLQHPADSGVTDADVPGDTPRPDADAPAPDDVLDAADVADADVADDRPAAPDADADTDAAMDVADADATDADAAMDVADADATEDAMDVPDAMDAADAMDVPDRDTAAPDADVPPPDLPDATSDSACVGATCVYGSCADLPRGSASGAYNLRGTGGTTWRGYCLVNADNSPAWTLVMKVDGARSTFQYDSSHWEMLSRLDDGVADLSRRDAKYEGYNATPVRQILLYTNTNPDGDRAVIVTVGDAPAPRVSLLSLMQMRPPPVMTLSRLADWVPIFPGARLQSACTRFGFNVNPVPGSMFARVRLGGVGDESDATCSSPDSWVGVGGFLDNGACGSRGSMLSAGNVSGCDGAAMPRSAPAFVWVYVR